MKKNKLSHTKWWVFFLAVFFMGATFSPNISWADAEMDALKEQLNQLSEMMQTVEKKLADMEAKNAEKEAEIEEMEERVSEAELHTATDKLSLGIELRSRGDSIHYQDMISAPDALMGMFFTDYNAGNPMLGGLNNATAAQIQGMMAGLATNPLNVPEKNDVDNDLLFTTRFRINMKAKINPQLSFGGRLAAYKVWGDSSGVQNYQGGMNDVTLDGTTSSLPTDDSIHLERAYFNYKDGVGSVPINFSLGRRPSTEGPPMEYGEYSLEGGSPMAHIINWQFDGASLSFGLEEATNIPGAAFKLCYGVGFESDFGNSTSMKSGSQLEDVHLFGFIANLFDNDTTSVVLNYAHAFDITDGFTGQTVMPFTATEKPNPLGGDNIYEFAPNTGGYISRTEPSTNLGDWDALTMLVRTNLTERFDKDIDLFFSFGWSHTSPDQTSAQPFYNLLGQGLLNSNGSLDSHSGYSLYTGAIFPMPLSGRWGFEYNWGSEYWFNFTGAEDSLVDSKLAVRGQVFETYYIQPVFNDNFFLKLGARYYDYDYTGSGNPLGAPVKISNATSMDALFPVADTAWNAYLSATLRF